VAGRFEREKPRRGYSLPGRYPKRPDRKRFASSGRNTRLSYLPGYSPELLSVGAVAALTGGGKVPSREAAGREQWLWVGEPQSVAGAMAGPAVGGLQRSAGATISLQAVAVSRKRQRFRHSEELFA